ncbi:MAG TPA: peptide chain release factor N(5)-glutamine methyltransferase [Acidimicrobiales bacterium]|nr:peptide chain release factor N(5)-glutamine methyltransferase [Acidimicrobiales bacterium]
MATEIGAGTATVRWRGLLAEAAARLGSAVDARRILERASGIEGAELHLGLDEPVTVRTAAHFEAMVQRREAGEPLQYVIGSWGFRSIDVFVDRRVLVPRPETEAVVEVALAELRRLGAGRHPTVVDLGTGSGAIALSIASEVAGADVWATDRSADALAVARANLAGLGRAGTRVRLVEGSWFSALPPILRGRVHLIVSNPPYVGESEVPDLPPEVARWEPRSALVGGPTGLEQVEAVIEGAPPWLSRPGSLVVEIAPHQASAAVSRALGAGFSEAGVQPDLAGRLRALVARI